MPNSKAINSSKFFGKDRYEYYLNELLTEQTVGGKKLSKQELKEGFSKRKNKISFEKFVDGLIGAKGVYSRTTSTVPSPSSSGTGIGRGGGSLVRSPTGSIQKYLEVASKSQKTGAIEESISAITTSVVSIADTLSQQKKIKEDSLNYERRKNEQDKRELSENKLEKRFEGLKKAAEKIIAPVKSILDKIIEFFTTVILGRIVYKIVEWLGDPNNASKVKSIIRFVKDWWPALLGSYILFGNSFSKFIRGTVGLLGRFIFQIGKVAIPRLLSIISKNPLASLIVGTSVAGTFARTGERERLKPELDKQRASVEKVQNDSSSSWYQKLGGFFAKQELTTGQRSQSITAPVPGAMFNGGGFVNGFVSGEKGVDKVPAMLSDGEFVMSRGAVEKYGVDTLEAMNAAGGGTNRPKVMSGTTYADGGGPIGNIQDFNYKDSLQDKRLNLVKSLQDFTSAKISQSGDVTLISALNNLTKVLRNSPPPSSGGGVTGYIMRSKNEAQKKFFGSGKTSISDGGGTGGYSTITKGRKYLNRVRNEIDKKIFGSRPEKEQRDSAPVDFGKMVSDVGGILQTIQGVAGAAEEAVPALIGGIVGINRTDTKISDDMQRALLAAKKTAAERGRDYVDYKDYAENAGGMAASLTMGRIGNSEWKRDSKGRIIGLKQVYDTNRSAKEAMQQANDSFMDFLKTGSPKSLMRSIYKPGEALLAKVQERGTTTHDVNFSEKVLGFKSEAIKNQESLEAKRPWWDKMGWFGGASGQMQRDKKYYGPGGSPSGSGKGQARQATISKTKPKTKVIKPPVSQKPKVVYGPPVPASGNKYRGGQRSATRTPNFNASTSGSKSKQNTLGITR
jgi:hypothetical protein